MRRSDGYWVLRISQNMLSSRNVEGMTSDGWRPIDTAPKDGTKILLGYFPKPTYDGSSVMKSCEVAFWHSGHQKWCGRALLNAEGYFSPTHWMPLPEPPK